MLFIYYILFNSQYYINIFYYIQIAEGLEWFCNFDKTTRIINSSQNYSLYPYLPYSFATWHCLFGTFTWPKITYPSAAYDVSNNVYF